MSDNGIGINPIDLSDAFAEFFDKKVKSIVDTCIVDENVYNGTKKVGGLESNFMTTRNVCDALNSKKIKNCEGYDDQKSIPQQWSISKIIPIHKKGSKTNIQNYRPIANLCAMTKVFEQLIINRIKEIEKLCATDITGNSQHGFK